MSQIETIMLFALGFILAALIAMFLGRGLWNYGVKIGQRRMQKLSPLSITEVQADRDRLRAEYAVMTRKLELRLDDLKDRMAEQMAEVSRNKTRIEKLHADIDDRDKQLAEKDHELNTLKANMAPLEGELASRTAAIQQLKEQIRNKSEAAENLERENVQLRMQLEERQAMSQQLEQRASALQEQVRVESDLSSTEKALNEKFAHLSKLTETIEAHKNNLLSQQEVIKTLTSTVEQGDAENALKQAASGAQKLSAAASTLEKSMGEAEKEAQRLQEELAELDKTWEARKGKRQAVGAQPGRKSATVTPLRPVATQAAQVAANNGATGGAKKKAGGKTVAAKMMEAAKKGQQAKTAAPATQKAAESETPQPEAAPQNADAVAEGASNGTGAPKVQKVLSLAQRIRALQGEITN